MTSAVPALGTGTIPHRTSYMSRRVPKNSVLLQEQLGVRNFTNWPARLERSLTADCIFPVTKEFLIFFFDRRKGFSHCWFSVSVVLMYRFSNGDKPHSKSNNPFTTIFSTGLRTFEKIPTLKIWNEKCYAIVYNGWRVELSPFFTKINDYE